MKPSPACSPLYLTNIKIGNPTVVGRVGLLSQRKLILQTLSLGKHAHLLRNLFHLPLLVPAGRLLKLSALAISSRQVICAALLAGHLPLRLELLPALAVGLRLLFRALVAQLLRLLEALDGLEHEGGVGALLESLVADVCLRGDVHDAALEQRDLMGAALRGSPLLPSSFLGRLARVLSAQLLGRRRHDHGGVLRLGGLGREHGARYPGRAEEVADHCRLVQALLCGGDASWVQVFLHNRP